MVSCTPTPTPALSLETVFHGHSSMALKVGCFRHRG